MNRMSKIARRLADAALCLGVMIVMGGCRHRVVLAPLPPVQAPVDLIEIPPPTNALMLESPQIKLPPVPIAAAAAKPKRERRRPKVAATPPAPEPAPAVPPTAVSTPAEENPIGALTAGGETNPQTQQDAADLLAAIEKRLNAVAGTDQR